MFGAFVNAKVLVAAAVATAGIAGGARSANAEHFRGGFGLNVVLPPVVVAPVCPAPVAVAPVYQVPVAVAAPACVAAAPVYVPAPTVVYAQPYYGPQYVVVNDFYHHHWAPVISFRGGRHW